MNYWTLVESNNIARERQETFVGFSGSYFDKYVDRYRIKKLSMAIHPQSWVGGTRELVKKKDGLYHQNRLAVAPNGSIFPDRLLSINYTTYWRTSKKRRKSGLLSSQRSFNRHNSFLHFNTTWICVKLSTFMPLQLNTLSLAHEKRTKTRCA